MISNPIFIIGTERSGSNLLRLQLDAHSNIAIPHPPHIMRDFSQLETRYGDLSKRQNLKALARDVSQVVRWHFAPWPFEVSEDLLFQAVKSPSLYGVYAALYDLYLEHSKKKRWGCKSTFMYQEIPSILYHHANPKFIHLVRDPRDVAASAEQSIFSCFHPYRQAQLWTEQQNEIESWASLKSKGQLLRVRYEDLTAHPERELRLIMSFLEEDFEPQQLAYHQRAAATQLAGLSQSWRNCAHPINQNSVGRYRQRLRPKDIGWVEFHAHQLMKEYAYPLDHLAPSQEPSRLADFGIHLSDQLKKIRAEAHSLLRDKNFHLRWRKKIYLRTLSFLRTQPQGS